MCSEERLVALASCGVVLSLAVGAVAVVLVAMGCDVM